MHANIAASLKLTFAVLSSVSSKPFQLAGTGLCANGAPMGYPRTACGQEVHQEETKLMGFFPVRNLLAFYRIQLETNPTSASNGRGGSSLG